MSGAEVATVITASVALLGVLGGAIKFVWSKIESRFARIEKELAECRKRDARGTRRRAVQRTVIELLWQEVTRLSPDTSSAQLRAKGLMDELKQGDLEAASEEGKSE